MIKEAKKRAWFKSMRASERRAMVAALAAQEGEARVEVDSGEDECEDEHEHEEGRTVKWPRHAPVWTTSFPDGGDWFARECRCQRSSFESISLMVERYWCQVNKAILPSARFSLRERVAMAVYRLTHVSTLEHAAKVHDMTPAAAERYFWQVVGVLVSEQVKTECFRVPTRENEAEWESLSDGFERICGYPGCCLAIGGLLVEIERPRDWVGWICSKNFPAENVQLVVDSRCVVRSIDIRPGSVTDKQTLGYSHFGRHLGSLLPEGKHVAGHASYALSRYVVVPYPVTDAMSAAEKLFNGLHARAQSTVKQAGEMIRSRFRILQTPLNQKKEDGDVATTEIAKVIMAVIALHNVLVDLGDFVEPSSSLEGDTDEEDVSNESDDDDSGNEEDPIEEQAVNQRERIKEYLSTLREHRKTHTS